MLISIQFIYNFIFLICRSPDLRCVRCGLEAAVRNVLDGEEAGAHVILVTRGDNDTLNLTDENAILELAKYYKVSFTFEGCLFEVNDVFIFMKCIIFQFEEPRFEEPWF